VDNSAKKIRVLHIHTLPVVSGSGINTFLTMKLSDSAVFESSLACLPGGKLEELVQNSGFKFYEIQHFRGPISLIHDLLALFEVYKLSKREKFDIIHTHNSKAGFIGRLAGRLAGNVKIVHTVHGYAFHSFEKFWRRVIFLIMEKIAAYWCDYMIFISQPLIEMAKKHKLLKCPYSKIYSGIELRNFQMPSAEVLTNLRKKYDLKTDDFVIGEVAKLWEGKGHRTIIEAARLIGGKIPNLKVLFVGEGYLEKELREMVRDYGLTDKIIFTGFQENVFDYTALFDVALLISDFEGMGRVILEAMLCGKPVIGTNVGGIPDLIIDNETGCLVEPSNAEKLAEKIIYLYNHQSERKRLAENASKRLTSEFTAEKMASEINKIYLALIKAQS